MTDQYIDCLEEQARLAKENADLHKQVERLTRENKELTSELFFLRLKSLERRARRWPRLDDTLWVTAR